MAEPPEFWTFVLSNAVVAVLGLLLSGLSLLAYRREPTNRSFVLAATGFGAITLGSLVEAVYKLGIRGSYELGGRELLALQTVEGVLIGAGLAVLFYSLRRYYRRRVVPGALGATTPARRRWRGTPCT